mgnify:FL=1
MGKKMGRPTIYDPSVHDDLVLNYMDKGLSIVQVCRKLEIGRTTIYEWAKNNPDTFGTLLTRARDYGESYWEYKFQEAMFNRESQPQLFRLYMGQRFRWKEQDSSDDQATATPQSIQVEIVDARKPD